MLMFTFHIRFFSVSAAFSESFSLRRAEQEFWYELFEVAALHALPISRCLGTVGHAAVIGMEPRPLHVVQSNAN